MSKLTCADCRAHLPDFCARTLSWRLNRQVVEHLRQCDDCLRLAEQEKINPSPIPKTTPHTVKSLVPGKGQAFVSWGVVFLLLMAAVSLGCYVYDKSMDEEMEEHVRTWIELRYPQGILGAKEIDWIGWLPYYRHEVHYPLLERGVTGMNRLGTVVITQHAWQREVDVRLDQPETTLMLSVPGEDEGRDPESTWAALEQLPEAVKVDMAVSTRHFLTPRAMAEMLERYNSELRRIYAYGGETVDERRQLPPLSLVLWTPQNGTISLEESERSLQENLKTVAQHPVIAGEQHMWKKRVTYVEEHGIRSYGALVRGTPQELIRLREVLELREAVIMNIDWVYAFHNRSPQRM